MKRYRVEFKARAVKELHRIARPHQQRIAQAIDRLMDDPRPSSSTPLVGETDAWRLRVGDFRVIYQIHEEIVTVHVVRIGHRREVYRRG